MTVAIDHRPVLHFTPQSGWMNDPNGLIHHRGRWHLFFQHNPDGVDWGNMSWGHAWSTDLLIWHEEPVAIRYDDDEHVFSGSVVVAVTSNSADAPSAGQLVAVYTSAATPSSSRAGLQAQAIAVSDDDGLTWTKRPGDPVLDRKSSDFRDPHVFRWSNGAASRWVMVTVEATERAVLIYASEDLVTWTPLSRFDPKIPIDGIWECPDLFPLTDPDTGAERWVLLLSVGTGHPASGGSGMLAFIGTFDGAAFTAGSAPEWVDLGADCYAGITFTDAPHGRRIMMAWMSNWQYAGELPEQGWRGAMTAPRELGLGRRAGALCLTQRLPTELLQLRVPETTATVALLADETAALTTIHAEPVLLRLRTDGAAWVLLIGETGAALTWNRDQRTLTVLRPAPSSAPEAYRTPMHATVQSDDPILTLEVLLDHGSIEIFADSGATVLTALLPTDHHIGTLTLRAGPAPVSGTAEVGTLRQNSTIR